jgi:hypothetical protein
VELTDLDSGQWRIQTNSGAIHEVDLDSGKYRRIRLWESAPLRQDNSWVDLISIAQCRIGAPACFWIVLFPGWEPTRRWTTPVISIERCSDG